MRSSPIQNSNTPLNLMIWFMCSCQIVLKGLWIIFNVSVAMALRFDCTELKYGLGDDFNARHPSLIFAGLRFETTNEGTNWFLSVYHRYSDPYEVLLPKADPDSFRLFLKQNKTVAVVYQTLDKKTVIDTYQLQKQLVLIDRISTSSNIDVFYLTDSPEGFFDCTTCEWIGKDRPIPNCKCHVDTSNVCFYDYGSGEYIVLQKYFVDFSSGVYPILNRYHCLNFFEISTSFYENGTWIDAITAVTNYLQLNEARITEPICLIGPLHYRRAQFYDFRWDRGVYDPCKLTLNSTAFEALKVEMPDEITEPPSLKTAEICWEKWMLVMVSTLTTVLATFSAAVIVLVHFGRRARKRIMASAEDYLTD